MKKLLFFSLLIIVAWNGNGQTIDDCATCSDQLLSKRQLVGKSVEELSLLRNEIYARKGFVFNSGKYNDYFRRQPWYKPVESNDVITLTKLENQNIELIKSLENKAQGEREAAITDLKKLKNALNNHEEDIVYQYFDAAG